MRKILYLAFIFILLFSLNLCADQKDWKEEKSTHFIIYYQNAPRDFVKRVVKSAEDYYNDIISDMGFSRYDKFWLWDDRAKIYVFDSQQHYVNTTNQPEWSGGAVYSKGKVIWTYPWAAGFFDTLLPHEMGHIIFRELIGYRSDIPTWLDEGIACYQEQARRWGSTEKVKKAMEEGRFIPFSRLNSLTPHQLQDREVVDLFYSEAVSIITFLIDKYGKYRFQKFIRELKSETAVGSALNSAYYDLKDFDSLGEVWEHYVKQGR